MKRYVSGNLSVIVAAIIASVLSQPANAQSEPAYANIFSDLRLGVMAHDQGPFSSHKEDGVDVNLELLFASPGLLEPILAPRPHLGVAVNTAGATSQMYFGLTWDFDITEDVFFEFAFGGAAHNGRLTREGPDEKALGCVLLFREAVDMGLRLGRSHSVAAHFDHISNANLCDKNAGLESVGLRYGYHF